MLLDFPLDLQEEILSYCHTKDLKNLVSCSRLYRITLKLFLWRSITVSNKQLLYGELENEKMEKLFQHTNRVHIYHDSEIWWDITHAMKRKICSNYKMVLEYSNLKILSTSYFPTGMLRTIGQLQNLVELSIEVIKNVYNYDVQFICKHLTQLKIFSLVDVYDRLDANALIHLDKLIDLEKLTVNAVPMKDDTLLRMNSRVSLKRLSATRSFLTDMGLSCLNNQLVMKELYLDYTPGITDSGILRITTMLRLEVLSLSGCAISDTGMMYLRRLTMLRELRVRECHLLSEATMSHVSALRNLRKFDASFCCKLSNGLSKLKDLSSLRELCIVGCKISDNDCLSISKLTSLITLDISINRVTDVGIQLLTSLVLLRELEIRRTDVTQSGILTLKEVLRYLKVIKTAPIRHRMILVE